MKTLKISVIFLFSLVALSTFAQKNKKAAPAPKVDSTTILQEFVGEYTISGTSDFSAVTVTFENGKLMSKADVQPNANEMKPSQIPDKFTVSSPEAYAEVIFVRDDNKKVKGVKIFYSGQEVSGEKVK